MDAEYHITRNISWKELYIFIVYSKISSSGGIKLYKCVLSQLYAIYIGSTIIGYILRKEETTCHLLNSHRYPIETHFTVVQTKFGISYILIIGCIDID